MKACRVGRETRCASNDRMRNAMRVGLDLGGVIVRSAQGVSVRDTPGPATAWREVCGAAPPGFATHVVSWTEIVTALGACE